MSAIASRSALPDPARPDSGAVLVSQWTVAGPQQQQDAADAAIDAYRRVRWPAPLLSYTVYGHTDGKTLLHYSQWTSQAALDEFRDTDREQRVAEIDAAVPGIQRHGVTRYQVHRSFGLGRAADARLPGAIVIVSVAATGPEPAKAWIEAVGNALTSDPNPHPGGISGHFHLNSEGTRILNYAEWRSVADHQDALATGPRGVGGAATPEWDLVQNFPGIAPLGVDRYRVLGNITWQSA